VGADLLRAFVMTGLLWCLAVGWDSDQRIFINPSTLSSLAIPPSHLTFVRASSARLRLKFCPQFDQLKGDYMSEEARERGVACV